MSQPWEDESLKGAYYAEKKRQASKKMTPPPTQPKQPGLTDAFGQAAKFEKRNRAINKATKPTRRLASGTDE